MLTDKKAWWDYYWRAYTQLHGSYVAAPAREIFPQIAVTNWFVVYSSRTDPHPYFVDDRILPPLAPPMFSATNPVAMATTPGFRTNGMMNGPSTGATWTSSICTICCVESPSTR